MKAAVVCYSRTGTTKRLAKALAKTLRAEFAEIGCPAHRRGVLRYLQAGYDSVTGRLPEIEAPQIDVSGHDLVVLAAPIWTSYPALPLRAWLADRPPLPERVAAVFTYGGHSETGKAEAMVEELLDRRLEGSLIVKSEEVRKNAFRDAMRAFADTLGATPGL